MWLSIALGGALGSISRYVIGLASDRLEYFFFGTLTSQCLGSLIIGVAAGLSGRDQRKTPTAEFTITGFFGGFTTFSLQTIELMQKNDWPRAAANIIASVTICLALTCLGLLLAQSFKKSGV
jgi:CrcB protein